MPSWQRMKTSSLLINYIYYPLVKYRLHISSIFLFLIVNVYTLFAKEAILWPVVISFFLWHYALYIFDRAYDYNLDALNQPKEAILPKERKTVLVISFIFCLMPIGILSYYHYPVIPYLPFIPITFLYTFPLYKNTRSKNILVLKNIYSALFIWTLPLTVIMFYYTKTEMSFWEIFRTYFLGLFLYVMIGEAFWDIRDVYGDTIEKVKTIPVVFGVLVTKIYLFALMAIDIIALNGQVNFSAYVYAILILIVKPSSPPWLFHIPPLLALYRFLVPVIFNT